jgi:hypothetical protein
MKAAIWSANLQLPTGFCYKCGAQATEVVAVKSKAGIASSSLARSTLIGGIAGVLRAGAASEEPRAVTYFAYCASRAR